MPISYREVSPLTCPHCHADFEAAIWGVLDAAEHPAAVEELRAGRLNLVTCPHCGATGPAGAPLIFHDRTLRLVVFVPTPDSEEHMWHEQARALHALLVGSIDIDQRRPYLDDLQVVQEPAGIVRKLDRAARRSAAYSQAQRPPPPLPATVVATSQGEVPPPLLIAVQDLLTAQTPAEFAQVVAHHSLLLAPTTDAALAQLAKIAEQQREPEVAAGLQQSRYLLARLREAGPVAPAPTAAPEQQLTDDLVLALVHVRSGADLLQLVTLHPELRQPWAIADLAAHMDQALDAGDDRQAQRFEELRQALLTLPMPNIIAPDTATESSESLAVAVEALLVAEDEAAVEAALNRYPILLTDAAHHALLQFAAEARKGGDAEMANYAVECSALLRNLRAGLA